MRERGLCVDHTTIYRWVQRYAPEIDKRCRPFLRRTTDSYRIDETYVRVGGAWHYRYRGVDSNGDTLDVLLRATRDRNAAIAFFRKTVGASQTTPPRVVNVDKNPAYPIAFEAIKHEGFVRPRSSLRQCKYLNNVIEQDHRFIKRRTRPMLGVKQFTPRACHHLREADADRFRVVCVSAPDNVRRPDLRLTVDTEGDLVFMRHVLDAAGARDGIVPLPAIIEAADRVQAEGVA